jgi:putative flippase GtrA
MTERVPADSSGYGADGLVWLVWRLPPGLRTLGRHQLGAFIATCIDFAAMIVCVEWLGISPVPATAVGSTLGGASNFFLGRMWVFRARSRGASGQAVRYALVSAASATWNSFGEHLVHDLGHVRYLLARVLVAFAVGVLWNFPMQRHFVFR